MKIYEKPMATIEKIDVKDVITTSDLLITNNEAAKQAIQAESANSIVFEW